jgi:RNA ligase (TIGR02306 family)
MRKLASIRQIKALHPIPEADAIEAAEIDGWKVVVKKGEFKVGDPCVYFEIDSFLPIEERYEFLRKGSYRQLPHRDGFRLRTCKFRKQLSQGLALPLVSFPELNNPELGSDVSETLKIELYEPPLPVSLAGLVLGNFPSYIPKTDVERIQNLPELFEKSELENQIFPEQYATVFELTIKLDGTSCTVYRTADDGVKFGVCSRNLDLADTEQNTYWQTVKALGLHEAAELTGYALQGELMGPGIQGNNEKLAKHEFYVFDVYSIQEHRYLSPLERRAFVAKFPNLKHVPILGDVELFKTAPTMDAMLQLASGVSLNEAAQREGIVAKSHTGRITFKAISNDWLLKH